MAPKLFGLWLLTKQCLLRSLSHILEVYELLADFPSKLLRWFLLNELFEAQRGQIIQYFLKKQRLQESFKKKRNIHLCNRTLFFLLFNPLNQLAAPQIYPVTICRGLDRGLDKATYLYKGVQISYTSNKYIIKMLHMHWCISINNPVM